MYQMVSDRMRRYRVKSFPSYDGEAIMKDEKTSEEKRLSTEALMHLLMKDRSLHSFLSSNADELVQPEFHVYLSRLRSEKGESAEKIIRRGQIEKSYGHQLFKGTRRPSRDTCLQLAFGFEMGVEQTQRLLRVAGKSTLYPRVMRDAAIIYSLHNGISLSDAQIILADLGLPIIGGGKHYD